MGELLDNLIAKMQTPEGKRKMDEYFDRISREQEFIEKQEQRYFDKFNTLTLSEQQNIIDKIINKYESDEYKDKEYKKGRFPINYLYSLLLSYSEKYGTELEPDENFCYEKYLFCESYIISLYCGQGTLIKVYRKNE